MILLFSKHSVKKDSKLDFFYRGKGSWNNEAYLAQIELKGEGKALGSIVYSWMHCSGD